MITKRIIPCLDVRDGQVVKGVNFQGLKNVASPVDLAKKYSDCGADKVSVNSGAVRKPQIIGEAAKKYGNQCVVISVDVKRVNGEFHVHTHGGRRDTGIEAIEWIKRCVGDGAGEVVVNSMDTDGVKQGFDLELLKKVCAAVKVPVIASGGAGSIEHFIQLFKEIPDIDAGLAASIFHFGSVEIAELKNQLHKNGINVRF